MLSERFQHQDVNNYLMKSSYKIFKRSLMTFNEFDNLRLRNNCLFPDPLYFCLQVNKLVS
jgi:hypothetical protein